MFDNIVIINKMFVRVKVKCVKMKVFLNKLHEEQKAN